VKRYLLNLVVLLLSINNFGISQSIQWTQKQSLPKPFRNGSAVSCKGKIYFMGGYCDATPERFEKSNYEYEPSTDTWSIKMDIPTGRSNFALANIDDKIYVIGGDSFSPKNEVYSPTTDSWDSLQTMLTPRQHISCATVDGKIFVIGGLMNTKDSPTPSNWSYKNISNKNEFYDPAKDTWSECAPMLTKRHGAFLATVSGKIYVIGGMGEEKDIWKTLSIVEMYDPKTDTWEIRKSIPEPRDGFGISVINEKIYVIGGFSGSAVVNTVYVYDPKKDVWITSTEFPNIENGSAACATIKNNIYIIGGCDKDYKANSNMFEGVLTEKINE
jgi:N-acetylneuraminic acid mutarotase